MHVCLGRSNMKRWPPRAGQHSRQGEWNTLRCCCGSAHALFPAKPCSVLTADGWGLQVHLATALRKPPQVLRVLWCDELHQLSALGLAIGGVTHLLSDSLWAARAHGRNSTAMVSAVPSCVIGCLPPTDTAPVLRRLVHSTTKRENDTLLLLLLLLMRTTAC